MKENDFKLNTWYVYKVRPQEGQLLVYPYTICFFFRGKDTPPKSIIFVGKSKTCFVNTHRYQVDINLVEEIPNNLIPFCEELFNKTYYKTKMPFRSYKIISYLIQLKPLIT